MTIESRTEESSADLAAELQFLRTHSAWLSDNWSMSPEGRAYKEKFDAAIDRLASLASPPATPPPTHADLAVQFPSAREFADSQNFAVTDDWLQGFDMAAALARLREPASVTVPTDEQAALGESLAMLLGALANWERAWKRGQAGGMLAELTTIKMLIGRVRAAIAVPTIVPGPGTVAARFNALLRELEKRFPDPEPYSAKAPEDRYLAMLDAAVSDKAVKLRCGVDPEIGSNMLTAKLLEAIKDWRDSVTPDLLERAAAALASVPNFGYGCACIGSCEETGVCPLINARVSAPRVERDAARNWMNLMAGNKDQMTAEFHEICDAMHWYRKIQAKRVAAKAST